MYSAIVIKYVAFFTIRVTLTVAFCFHIWLWLRIWTKSVGGSGLDEKKARIGGFEYHYSPLPIHSKPYIVGYSLFVKLQVTSETFHTYLKPISKVIHSQMVCSTRRKEICCRTFSITLFIFCQTDQGCAMVCHWLSKTINKCSFIYVCKQEILTYAVSTKYFLGDSIKWVEGIRNNFKNDIPSFESTHGHTWTVRTTPRVRRKLPWNSFL